MSSVDFLVKLRDAAQMIADAANEELEKKAPPEAKPLKPWDPGKIKWIPENGFRGPYERYPGKDQKAEATDDYKNMLEDLKAHGGKLTRNSFFYWIFQDQATVGRKK